LTLLEKKKALQEEGLKTDIDIINHSFVQTNLQAIARTKKLIAIVKYLTTLVVIPKRAPGTRALIIPKAMRITPIRISSLFTSLIIHLLSFLDDDQGNPRNATYISNNNRI